MLGHNIFFWHGAPVKLLIQCVCLLFFFSSFRSIFARISHELCSLCDPQHSLGCQFRPKTIFASQKNFDRNFKFAITVCHVSSSRKYRVYESSVCAMYYMNLKLCVQRECHIITVRRCGQWEWKKQQNRPMCAVVVGFNWVQLIQHNYVALPTAALCPYELFSCCLRCLSLRCSRNWAPFMRDNCSIDDSADAAWMNETCIFV